MIRNIKSPSQTDLVFIHCHLNPPGTSQTKITLLSLVTLKYNLKFCMKAAAAGLLALKTSIRSCVERSVNIPQSTRPGLTLSPCQCAGVHCLHCADIFNKVYFALNHVVFCLLLGHGLTMSISLKNKTVTLKNILNQFIKEKIQMCHLLKWQPSTKKNEVYHPYHFFVGR